MKIIQAYAANDGTLFKTGEECKKYENERMLVAVLRKAGYQTGTAEAIAKELEKEFIFARKIGNDGSASLNCNDNR